MLSLLRCAILITAIVSCNKPHNMGNSGDPQGAKTMKGQEDESVKVPSNITGAFLTCESSAQVGSDTKELDLKCGLQAEDGNKIPKLNKDLKWKYENSEQKVSVSETKTPNDKSFDVSYKLKSNEKGAILRSITLDSSLSISSKENKSYQTVIPFNVKKTVSELEKELSDKVSLSQTNASLCPGGIKIDSNCWYYGQKGVSCKTVCEGRGGYSQVTETYANNKGASGAVCSELINQLGYFEIENGLNPLDYTALRAGGYLYQKTPYVYKEADRKTGCATYYGTSLQVSGLIQVKQQKRRELS